MSPQGTFEGHKQIYFFVVCLIALFVLLNNVGSSYISPVGRFLQIFA